MKKRKEISMTPEESTAFVSDADKIALATVGKDGFPHLVAMNFFVRDGAIYMTSYGKAQKVLNIRRNPKVAIMAESGRNYAELRGVMIRGECEIIEDWPTVEALMLAIRSKGAGDDVERGTLSAAARKRVILKVVPKKIASWDHRKLGGRY